MIPPHLAVGAMTGSQRDDPDGGDRFTRSTACYVRGASPW